MKILEQIHEHLNSDSERRIIFVICQSFSQAQNLLEQCCAHLLSKEHKIIRSRLQRLYVDEEYEVIFTVRDSYERMKEQVDNYKAFYTEEV